jgi:SAM-dependent methyltransferase
LMNNTPHPLLTIESHPFFIGCVEQEHEDNLPPVLPFSLYVDEKLAVPRMAVTREIQNSLAAAYAIGSMASTPLGESSLAAGRLTQVLACLLGQLGNDVKGKRILEVGCGNGMLLGELQNMGAEVTGIEISPQAEIAASRYGLTVVREPLRRDLFGEKFDCCVDNEKQISRIRGISHLA